MLINQREEIRLRREEDDIALGLAGQPRRCRGEDGFCVLLAAVGRGNQEGGGEGGCGDGESVDVHLGGEALGDVGRCNPAGEGDKAVCVKC